jgi:NAD(P)H-flavin reductase
MSALPNPYLPINGIIRGLHMENADTATFRLELPPSVPGQDWIPGQFNMLYIFGKGDVPISISRVNSPREVVHTIRAVGKVSRALCSLEEGQQIGFRGPFGKGWPVDVAVGKDLVIVAGGIGLAPLRPVVDHVRANRGLYKNVFLIYGARSPKDMIFKGELDVWRGPLAVQVTVDSAEPGWKQYVGLVTPLVQRVEFDPANTVAMLCGPEIMMDFCIRTLLARGLPPGDIYLSMERSMKCAIGLCGHCQYGGDFVCKDGPVFSYDRISDRLKVKEY